MRTIDGVLLSAALALGAAASLRRFGVHGVTVPAGLLLAGGTLLAFVPLLRLFGGDLAPERKRTILAVLFGCHLVATLFFFPPEDMIDGRPVLSLDHAVHYYEVERAREMFPKTLSLAVYDPYFMAGYPGGTVFEIDTSGVALWCALARFLDAARAYKAFIALAYLSAVFTVFGGARRLRLRFDESVCAVVLFLVFWHWGRPYAGDFRFAGMFSYLFVCHLSLYLTGVFRSVLGGERMARFYVLGPLAFLVHPTAAVLVPVPFVALWLVERRAHRAGAERGAWERRLLEKTALWCALIVAVNAIWLVPFIRYLDIKIPSQSFFQIRGAGALVRMLARPGNLPALALAALAAGGFIRLAHERRFAEAIPPAAASLFLLGIAAFGVYLPLFDQMEPGRFLVPAFIFMAPLGGAGLAPLAGWFARSCGAPRLVGPARGALLATLVVGVPPLALAASRITSAHTLSTTPTTEVAEMIDALRGNVNVSGRLMVEDGPAWLYGESHFPSLLPLYTGVEQIGGPYAFMFIEHGFTTFQRGRTMGEPLSTLAPGRFRSYVDLYNVHWILTATPECTEYVKGLHWARPMWASRHFTLWGVEAPASFASRGGVTVRATYDTIRVAIGPSAASPDEVLLGYHWDRGLRVAPPARIVPERRLDDPVPFIRLEPGGASDIVITYR